MQIYQTLESIKIETQNLDLFNKLQNIIKKNFKNNIGSKDKIIAFYEDTENIQRKYFFKLLNKIYGNKQSENINFIMAKFKPIKLVYIQKNAISKIIDVDVSLKFGCFILKFNNKNEYFIKYINEIFKNNKKTYNQNILKIYANCEKDLFRFKEFVFKKKHLNFIVNFHYNFKDFYQFKIQNNGFKEQSHDKEQNSTKSNNRFNALSNFMANEFKILNCEVGCDFKFLRNSYLKLAKIYHPDNKEKGDKREFQKILNAYENLKSIYSQISPEIS